MFPCKIQDEVSRHRNPEDLNHFDLELCQEEVIDHAKL